MRCPSCRHDNRADARFCEECGQELRVSGQPCPGCGTINSPDARFCIGCGSSLPGAEAAPPPVAEEPEAIEICPRCGAQNPARLRFCEQCAMPLAEEAPAKPPPPVSPPPAPPEPVPRKTRTSALIRVFLSQTDILIEPGQRGELSVTVQNLSEIVDQYLVEVEGLDTTWYTVSPPNVSLFPQDRGEVKVSFHPSPEAKAGKYDFSVRVSSRENPIDWTRVQATLEVLPVSFFEMTLSPQRRSITGAEATFRLQLSNPGNVDLELSLSATDPEEGCTYLFQPQRVTVQAGASREVPLTVKPKLWPSEEARRYDFTVKAVPADTRQKARMVLGQLECKPLVISFELGIWPQRLSTDGEGTFQVQLTNLGNAEIALDLSAADPEEGCTYRFEPQRVTLAAGGSKEVSLTVRPKERTWEEARRYDFRVRAVPPNAPHKAREVRGQLECKPLVISFEVGISPERQSTKGRGTFRVRLTNLGNAEIALDLSAMDPEEACSYRFKPDGVTLAGAESKEVLLVVTPRRRPPAGETKSYDFTVKATPADAPQLAQTTTGRLNVLRRKRSRALVAVAVGVPLLALLAFAIRACPGPAPVAVYPSTPTRRPDRPTHTPTPPPTPTAISTPTPAIVEPSPPREAFGPRSGSLRHEDDGTIETYRADVSLIDFWAGATFYNPYPSTQGSWDYGFLCRYVRSGTFHSIYVVSDGTWIHRVRIGGDSTLLAEGDLDGLRTGADQSNTVEIVVVGDDGEFYVNGELVALLDMSGLIEAGDVRAATGNREGNEIEGEVTRFEDFIVEALD